MRFLGRLASSVLMLALAAGVAAGAWWLFTNKPAPGSAVKSPPAANVGKVVKEEELNTITLTDEAEKRIGLTVQPIARKAIRRVRVYGGEVVVPAGQTILVSAPLTGVLKAAAHPGIKAGESVRRGQPIFQLTPLLTPDGRATMSAALADAEGQVNNARTPVELTKIALDRAKRVLREGAGSQRQVDEAQAAFDLASKTFDAATMRLGVLKKVVGDAESGTAAPIAIEAPEDGILRTLSALPGQTVPGGAPLFEVIDVSTVWVRVPLPVGDMDSISRSEPALVGPLSALPSSQLTPARPVIAPPSANPIAATVDVFYELPNVNGKLLPGQRLGVTIPLANVGESLSVPWSALVFDIHGGTWVYEQVGPRRYLRRRVVVSHTVGNDAALLSGPPPGVKVVTAGAQELFGAETGFAK